MQKNSRYTNVLKFKTPSSLSPWESALPLGNGRVGALVQGGVKKDKIMLTNEKALWKGTVGVLPDVADKMKEVRSFMASKNPVMAGVTLTKAFQAKKYTPAPFVSVPVADLIVEQVMPGRLTKYQKVLGLETAEASVQFSACATSFERNCFVAYDSDFIYYELSKSGNAPIVVSLALNAHDKTTAVFNGEIEGAIENEKITLSGSLIGYEFESDGMVYGAMARVLVDSKAVLDVTETRLRIENAEKVLVVIKTYASKVKEKPAEKVRAELLNIRQVSYEKAFKTHQAEYLKAFSKTEIRMPKEKDFDIETLSSMPVGESPLLIEKLFNFGKYLIATSIPKSFGAPLVTGLLGKHYKNEEAIAEVSTALSAMYSPMFMLGHEEKVYNLISYFTKFQDDLKKNAFRVYKSKGFMVPEKFVMGSALPASIEPSDLSTITGGAVIANLFYDYFLYTKDVKFLKTEALPFMTSVADFYMNYFFKDGNGVLTSCPSFAPDGKSKFFENRSVGVYQNSTADFVVARALINNIMNVANIYSLNVERLVDYQNFLNSIPEIPLAQNSIKEFRDEENSILSSGIMHLYNVFGTKEIQNNGNPVNVAPYLNSLDYKIDRAMFSQNLVALGRLFEISANLGQANAMENLLKYILENFLSDNLITLNADKANASGYCHGDSFFNLSGNMLLVTGILECMVLTYQNNIAIMPAKPAFWKEGGVSSVYTKQNVLVDIDFDDKRGNLTISLKATKATKFNLILPRGVKRVKNYTIDPVSPRIDNITLSAGKGIVIDAKY